MDYAKAREVEAEHKPTMWLPWRRRRICRACRITWKCPSRLAAERVIAAAEDVDTPSEWRLGRGREE